MTVQEWYGWFTLMFHLGSSSSARPSLRASRATHHEVSFFDDLPRGYNNIPNLLQWASASTIRHYLAITHLAQ